ncbi:hypothetical protein MNBD_GAMMA06-115 [hydrothermal vent metagenome]|uniref:Flagellar FliJ protein n=1 Tax=hydrothermal vent metagenome TaxID=652676 RepID=A0A3B0XDP0_9ZZZZ
MDKLTTDESNQNESIKDKLAKNKNSLDIARRQESRAYNELEYRSQQAKEQKSQLESLLEHRKECMAGLANAHGAGLTPVHVREYQLLLSHINSVVEAIEYKVNSSQDNLDKAQDIWQQKNAHFLETKKSPKENENEKQSEEINELANDAEISDKKYYADQG